MVRNSLILIAGLFSTVLAHANSCCGQNPSSFLVLYQHQKAAITPSLTSLQTLGRTSDNGDFRLWNNNKKRTAQAYTVSSAITSSEHGQFFINTGFTTSQYSEYAQDSSSQKWNDTLIGYTYDVLPEYTFSYWRPNLYLSLLGNIPTGHSIYDSDQLSEGANVTGHNQWGFGLGVTARKVIFPWTMVLQMKTIRLLEKEFPSSPTSTSVSGFYDSSLSTFVNYLTPYWDLTVTGGLIWNSLSSRTLNTTPSKNLTSQSTSSTGLLLSLQKVISDEVSFSFAYMDQSLVGPARNSLVNKTYTLSFNYNFL